METTGAKLVAAGILLAAPTLASLGAWLALRWGRGQQKGRGLVALNCLAGGVFLGTCFLHLAVEGRQRWTDYLQETGAAIRFPVFEAVMAVGLFVVLFLDSVASLAAKKLATWSLGHQELKIRCGPGETSLPRGVVGKWNPSYLPNPPDEGDFDFSARHAGGGGDGHPVSGEKVPDDSLERDLPHECEQDSQSTDSPAVRLSDGDTLAASKENVNDDIAECRLLIEFCSESPQGGCVDAVETTHNPGSCLSLPECSELRGNCTPWTHGEGNCSANASAQRSRPSTTDDVRGERRAQEALLADRAFLLTEVTSEPCQSDSVARASHVALPCPHDRGGAGDSTPERTFCPSSRTSRGSAGPVVPGSRCSSTPEVRWSRTGGAQLGSPEASSTGVLAGGRDDTVDDGPPAPGAVREAGGPLAESCQEPEIPDEDVIAVGTTLPAAARTASDEQSSMSDLPLSHAKGHSPATVGEDDSRSAPREVEAKVSSTSCGGTAASTPTALGGFGKVEEEAWTAAAPGSMGMVVLVMALSFHTVFDGLAVGLQPSASAVWQTTGVISLHRGVVTFCLALQLFPSLRARAALPLLTLTVIAAPFGLLIGLVVTSASDVSGVGGSALACSVLQGLAAGTFLYVTFFEILKDELVHEGHPVKVVLVMVGFAVSAGLKCVNV